MKQFIFAIVAVLGIQAGMAQAQAPLGEFSSVQAMEQEMAARLMGLEFEAALSSVDPKGRSLSQEQKDRFVSSLSNYFRKPLTQKAILKEEVFGGGFRRALYGYWRDGLPIYFYVVTHQRQNSVWVLQYNIETTFSKVINKF